MEMNKGIEEARGSVLIRTRALIDFNVSNGETTISQYTLAMAENNAWDEHSRSGNVIFFNNEDDTEIGLYSQIIANSSKNYDRCKGSKGPGWGQGKDLFFQKCPTPPPHGSHAKERPFPMSTFKANLHQTTIPTTTKANLRDLEKS